MRRGIQQGVLGKGPPFPLVTGKCFNTGQFIAKIIVSPTNNQLPIHHPNSTPSPLAKHAGEATALLVCLWRVLLSEPQGDITIILTSQDLVWCLQGGQGCFGHTAYRFLEDRRLEEVMATSIVM